MKILTLNCFGLPFFAPHSTKRLRSIIDHINDLNPDIVCLQEIFLPWHKRMLEKRLKEKYPYSFVPRSGFFRTAGGLCFFSRFPITEPSFQKFSETGSWSDWTWVNKINSQGFMRLTVLAPTPCHFVHSHLSCNFQNDFTDTNPQTRIQKIQLGQCAEAIKTFPESEAVFCIGDLNVPPHTELFSDFLQKIGAHDLTSTLESSLRGVFYPFPNYFSKIIHKGKIDYILLRGKKETSSSWHYVWKDGEILSDHAGILTEINF
jgi:endonuclease/exonuclease/phosphatase family metal-dependent hydrolase